jgi:hypothetical protein
LNQVLPVGNKNKDLEKKNGVGSPACSGNRPYINEGWKMLEFYPLTDPLPARGRGNN